jgi:cell fate (sporulation/competence/biofilm development) regulator YlbF (YheA/YmcA/DUF963 family)
MANAVVIAAEVTVEARQAARDFAAALTRTPQFKAFELASDRMQQDAAAQEALAAFQHRQAAGSAGPEGQAELGRLYQVFLDVPSVAALLEAQTEVQALSREAAEHLSSRIGLNYAAVCGSCHCG